uniref:DUF6053 domain-containing protein n=1 Tax=Streptomyces galbus TaxID=33898 RepID=UPI00383B0161
MQEAFQITVSRKKSIGPEGPPTKKKPPQELGALRPEPRGHPPSRPRNAASARTRRLRTTGRPSPGC